MKTRKLLSLLLACTWWIAAAPASFAQVTGDGSGISLQSLDAFESGTSAWRTAGSVVADRETPSAMNAGSGTGILVYEPADEGESIVTGMRHGDVVVEFDFMTSSGAASGVYLQGRYEVQLADSWGVRTPRVTDSGGIVRAGGGGLHPHVNAGRAPGLWQHMKIVFRAPTFDAEGEKTAHAVIEQVVLNGVVVQEGAELAKPSRGAPFTEEASEGPLAFQRGTAPIAFKNIRYRAYDSTAARSNAPSAEPIFVEPGKKPVVLRSYVDHRGDKKLFGIFVGDPTGVHYAMDLQQGTLLHLWRGPFLDAGTVWRGRGMQPNSRKLDEPEPLGSKLTLSGAPTTVTLDGVNAPWPDSLVTGYTFDGYSMDGEGRPVFSYRVGGVRVTDRPVPDRDGRVIRRELTYEGTPEGGQVWSRLAAGSTIEKISDGSYSVDGQAYEVEILELPGEDPLIRNREGRAELLVPISPIDDTATLEYSIIW